MQNNDNVQKKTLPTEEVNETVVVTEVVTEDVTIEEIDELEMVTSAEAPKQNYLKVIGFQLKKFSMKILPHGKIIEKIYLIILLITFITVLFKSGGVFSEDKILLFTAAGAGLFILRSLRGKVQLPKTFTILYAIFIAITIITSFFSIDIYNSILLDIEMVAAGLFCILGYDIVYGKYSRRWILNAFTGVFACILIISLFFYARDKTSLLYPLSFPIYMGTIILALLPFALTSTVKTKGIKKVLFLFAVTIFLVSIVFTFAKSLYVLAALEIVVFIITNLLGKRKDLIKKKNYIPLAIIAGVILLATLVLRFPTSGSIPFDVNSFADRNIPLALRGDILMQAFNTFKSYPLQGVGIGNFRTVSLYTESKPWEITYYVYNEYLEMIISTGIFGGLAFLSVFGYFFYEILKKRNRTLLFIKRIPEALELTTGIIAILILAFFYPVLHVIAILFVLFLFIGMLLKDLRVDTIQRLYLDKAPLYTSMGISFLLLFITAYAYIINYLFLSIRNNLTQKNVTAGVKSLERISSYNPLDTEYATVLSQVYLSSNDAAKSLTTTQNALRYNKISPYLIYSEAVSYYFKGDYSTSSKVVNKLLAKAPYADPTFYLLPLQIDQVKNNNTAFVSQLKHVAAKFPINSTFNLYRPLFTQLGYTDAMYKVNIELALITKNTSYYNVAKDLNPNSFSMQ